MWNEEDHPRDEDGKFTDGAGNGENNNAGRKTADKVREYAKRKSSKERKRRYVINDPDSIALADRIDRGEFLEIEELKAHPAVKKIEEGIAEYDKKYGVTANNNSAKRQLLRKRWKQNFLEGKGVDTMPPGGGSLKKENKATIVVGLPAAGKSSRIVNPLSDEQGAFIMDSDEMKRLIPEFKASKGGAANAVHKESKDLMKEAFNEFINGSMRGTNVIIPVIGDEADKLNKKYIDKLISAGYDIEIAYKGSTAKQSANRVIARAIKTGRFIPMSVVEGYDDNKVRKAYNEVLNTDYNGKKVKKSKYSEV